MIDLARNKKNETLTFVPVCEFSKNFECWLF